jgi:hypothetical protein
MWCNCKKSDPNLTLKDLLSMKDVMVLNRYGEDLVVLIFIQARGARPYRKFVLSLKMLLWCIVFFRNCVQLFQLYVEFGGMSNVWF